MAGIDRSAQILGLNRRLPARAEFQSPRRWVDELLRMPLRPNDSRTPSTQPNKPGSFTVPQVAHELNSLLDGALRFVRLARGRLDREDCVDQAIDHLQAAEADLRRMSHMLDHFMRQPREEHSAWPDSERRLRDEVDRIVESVVPAAVVLDVFLSVEVKESAERLRAGTLGLLILNGLRNAIASCAGVSGPKRVCFYAAVQGDELILEVVDNGNDAITGPDIMGQSLGMPVCRTIATTLQGCVDAARNDSGCGTRFVARIPISSLEDASP